MLNSDSLPGAPTIGPVTVIDSTHVRVSWADGSAGASTITGYIITPYIDGAAQTASTYSVGESTIVAGMRTVSKSVITGTTYRFTVAAVNAHGTGVASALSNSIVAEDTGGPQTLLWDGRFQPGDQGTYQAVSGNSGPAVGVWGASEYEGGSASRITVYDASSKGAAWWPDPYAAWASLPAAFASYTNQSLSVARAQVHDRLCAMGDEVYFSWAVYVPSAQGDNWPVFGEDTDWNVIMQIHSAPYSGSPVVSASIQHIDGALCLAGHSGTGYYTWKQPIAMDQWHKVVCHIVASTSPSNGLLEVWVNGTKTTQILPRARDNHTTSGQYLTDNDTTAHVATECADTSGEIGIYLNCYRKGSGSNFGTSTVTVFHSGLKVGASYNDVL